MEISSCFASNPKLWQDVSALSDGSKTTSKEPVSFSEPLVDSQTVKEDDPQNEDVSQIMRLPSH